MGTVSWRKPINFGLSFGVTLLTFGWILGHTRHRPTAGPLLAWGVSVASALEVVGHTVNLMLVQGGAARLLIESNPDRAKAGS